MKLFIINEIDNQSHELDLHGVSIAKASPRRDTVQSKCEELNQEGYNDTFAKPESKVTYSLVEVEVPEEVTAYDLAREKARSAKVKAKEAHRDAFLAGCRVLFRSYPELKSFGWNQYSPCEHNQDYDTIELGSFHVDSHFPNINGIKGDNVDKGWGLDRDTGKCGQLREPSQEAKLQQPVKEFLESFDDEDLLDMFGDEVTVTVFEDGTIETEDCDND